MTSSFRKQLGLTIFLAGLLVGSLTREGRAVWGQFFGAITTTALSVSGPISTSGANGSVTTSAGIAVGGPLSVNGNSTVNTIIVNSTMTVGASTFTVSAATADFTSVISGSWAKVATLQINSGAAGYVYGLIPGQYQMSISSGNWNGISGNWLMRFNGDAGNNYVTSLGCTAGSNAIQNGIGLIDTANNVDPSAYITARVNFTIQNTTPHALGLVLAGSAGSSHQDSCYGLGHYNAGTPTNISILTTTASATFTAKVVLLYLGGS